MKSNWFEDWFNSKYYHVLYRHRDDSEADLFVSRLVDYLDIEKGGKIIDVGCGAGRHAFSMSKHGYEVSGIDLSPTNIQLARKNCQGKIDFQVCDMRTTYQTAYYDCAVNLFTSFGYFQDDADDLNSLQAISKSLKKSGLLVLDYFNSVRVEKELQLPEKIKLTKEGIEFETFKYIKDGFVIKEIYVHDEKRHHFVEKVKLIDMSKFKAYFAQSDLDLIECFGSYDLEPYFPNVSERLIMVAKKR